MTLRVKYILFVHFFVLNKKHEKELNMERWYKKDTGEFFLTPVESQGERIIFATI